MLEVAGVKVDVTSRLKADFPDYAKRLQVVATNHVASAFFYHSVTEAVLKCLLRFGAKDGDGGVLGRVKGKMCFLSTLFLSRDVESSLRVISRTVLRAHTFPLRSFFLRAKTAYIGMTEEQRRLMLHCHVLVWVYGYTDFSSFRSLLDKTPEKHSELARFLERVIFNQVATLGDVNVVLHGHDVGDVTHAPVDTETPGDAPDPTVIDARQRIARAPPSECFPRDGEPRCQVHDEAFARLFYLDLAELIPATNLHRCQPTCHKYNHRDTCRYT